MSYSLKAIATLLLIINAVNLISCASINYVDPERLQCVLVFSTEDKTFKRCRYADFTLAFCDGDELFEAKNCFRNPGFDSECLICSTVHKIGVVTESNLNDPNFMKRDGDFIKINLGEGFVVKIKPRPKPSVGWYLETILLILCILFVCFVVVALISHYCSCEPKYVTVPASSDQPVSCAIPMPWYNNYDKFLLHYNV